MDKCTLYLMTKFGLNPLPNKILDRSKLKAFADDKTNVNEKFKFCLGRVENNVGKEENTGYQYFLLFPTMLSKALYFRVVKSQDCVVKSQVESSCLCSFVKLGSDCTQHALIWHLLFFDPWSTQS